MNIEREIPMTNTPCPFCVEFMDLGTLRPEAVQRMPAGAMAPLNMDGRKWCFDCNAAHTVCKVTGLAWDHARVAVANDRQEQYRMPGIPMGLVQAKLMKPSAPGDLEAQIAWLESIGFMSKDE